jgi:hypothetical protein
MAKKNFQHDESEKPETSPEVYRQLEVALHKINFLNEEIKVVQEVQHLSSQMQVDFDKENASEMFDEMKQITKVPLITYLNEQVSLSTNLFKNLTHEVLL